MGRNMHDRRVAWWSHRWSVNLMVTLVLLALICEGGRRWDWWL